MSFGWVDLEGSYKLVPQSKTGLWSEDNFARVFSGYIPRTACEATGACSKLADLKFLARTVVALGQENLPFLVKWALCLPSPNAFLGTWHGVFVSPDLPPGKILLLPYLDKTNPFSIFFLQRRCWTQWSRSNRNVRDWKTQKRTNCGCVTDGQSDSRKKTLCCFKCGKINCLKVRSSNPLDFFL